MGEKKIACRIGCALVLALVAGLCRAQGLYLAPGNGRFIYHPGAVPAPSAQAEHDIAQCRRYAETSAAQFLRSADKVEAYNGSMYGCLKGLGYRIHAPAA